MDLRINYPPCVGSFPSFQLKIWELVCDHKVVLEIHLAIWVGNNHLGRAREVLLHPSRGVSIWVEMEAIYCL